MIMRKFIGVTLVAVCMCSGGNAAKAGVIYWNTWTSDSGGSMVVGSTPVTSTYSTASYHADVANYPSWDPSQTFADGVVVGNAPVSSNGIMRLIDGNSNVNTLSFSSALLNPVMAFWSLGSNSDVASFVFDATPLFVVGGPSAEYNGTAITVSGNTVSGHESNGTVEFLGTFSTISWTNPQKENWYGFNVGAPSVNSPEPGSMTLLGLGLASFGGLAWLKTRKMAVVAA